MKAVRFYKNENGFWFIDLPDYLEQGGHISHLVMVSGADVLLDIVSEQGNECFLELSEMSTDFAPDRDVQVLVKTKEPVNLGVGCTYRLGLSSCYFDKLLEIHKSEEIWLCPTTLFVFEGKYPNRIYFSKINEQEYHNYLYNLAFKNRLS